MKIIIMFMIGGDNDNKNNCSKDHENNINNNYNDDDNCFNDDDWAKNDQVNLRIFMEGLYSLILDI